MLNQFVIITKRKTIRSLILIIAPILLCGNPSTAAVQRQDSGKILVNVSNHPIPFSPKKYICLRSAKPLKIDGTQKEKAWKKTRWSEPFVDIEGKLRDKPNHKTRVKMLWDDRYFYIFARMEEPHVWGRIQERDAVIFHDNDFEVFIDPDGDTHYYAELEMNALNTVWDLLLTKPYRDGGIPLTNWDIKNLKTAVHIEGTLNNPSDTDQYWTAEIAIPWKALGKIIPKVAKPRNNDQWRVNFSRVQWKTEIKDNEYRKKRDEYGNVLPEQNWVWSPQGKVDMHRPETWGIVQFSKAPAGSEKVAFISKQRYQIEWYMRNLYYRQNQYHRENGTYADTLKQLRPESLPELPFSAKININSGSFWYVISLTTPDNRTWMIRENGKIRQKNTNKTE